MTAPGTEPPLPRCATCGDERGPWRPTDERYPSGAQVFACSDGCSTGEETASSAGRSR